MKLSPLNRRRFARFKANKRGWWSLWIFLVLFGLSLKAGVNCQRQTAGDQLRRRTVLPGPQTLPRDGLWRRVPLEANYKSPYIRELLAKKDAWVLWPPIPYSYQSINYDLKVPAPAPPSAENWLGTDDQGRDVLARVIYGFRISVLFALTLTILSSIIGVIADALQGLWRLGRPGRPAVSGNLVGLTCLVPADYSRQFCATQFLVAVVSLLQAQQVHRTVLVHCPVVTVRYPCRTARVKVQND